MSHSVVHDLWPLNHFLWSMLWSTIRRHWCSWKNICLVNKVCWSCNQHIDLFWVVLFNELWFSKFLLLSTFHFDVVWFSTIYALVASSFTFLVDAFWELEVVVTNGKYGIWALSNGFMRIRLLEGMVAMDISMNEKMEFGKVVNVILLPYFQVTSCNRASSHKLQVQTNLNFELEWEVQNLDMSHDSIILNFSSKVQIFYKG